MPSQPLKLYQGDERDTFSVCLSHTQCGGGGGGEETDRECVCERDGECVYERQSVCVQS